MSNNTDSKQDEALEPCPFCGVVPAMQSHTQEDEMDEGRYLFLVECGNGKCPMGLVSTGGPFKEQGKAATAWNSRASTPPSESLTIPDRVAINPTVAARYSISDRRIGDVEYVRVGAVGHCRISGLTVALIFSTAQEADRFVDAIAPAAVSSHLPAEKPEYDLDPLEFWCDLAEVLGHPRPAKADVPALVSEVKDRLAAPPRPEGEQENQ